MLHLVLLLLKCFRERKQMTKFAGGKGSYREVSVMYV